MCMALLNCIHPAVGPHSFVHSMLYQELLTELLEQGFIQDFKLGGGNPCFVEAR